MTVEAVKTKLITHCGTSASAMILQLKDEGGNIIATLSSEKKLGYYSPHDGYAYSANAKLDDVLFAPSQVILTKDWPSLRT